MTGLITYLNYVIHVRAMCPLRPGRWTLADAFRRRSGRVSGDPTCHSQRAVTFSRVPQQKHTIDTMILPAGTRRHLLSHLLARLLGLRRPDVWSGQFSHTTAALEGTVAKGLVEVNACDCSGPAC